MKTMLKVEVEAISDMVGCQCTAFDSGCASDHAIEREAQCRRNAAVVVGINVDEDIEGSLKFAALCRECAERLTENNSLFEIGRLVKR